MASSTFNKISMAILTAVLIAFLAGFVSKKLIHPTFPAERAFKVEVPETDTAGAAAPAAPAEPDPVSPILAAASVEDGQKLTRACAACHSFDKGGANKVGPNLWNIVNNKHAHAEGFAYSDAMKSQEGPWDYEHLNRFLANPKATIPGTKMNYAGMRKVEDRAALIAYLRTLSDDPAPLP
ncbi:c-type cytochrome [Niveispirillum fermenti]|uniref:c-type cytochrome n=1 Tax=Niveispirillum fermenti TaxID=1233113 RepID=UPI003A881060